MTNVKSSNQEHRYKRTQITSSELDELDFASLVESLTEGAQKVVNSDLNSQSIDKQKKTSTISPDFTKEGLCPADTAIDNSGTDDRVATLAKDEHIAQNSLQETEDLNISDSGKMPRNQREPMFGWHEHKPLPLDPLQSTRTRDPFANKLPEGALNRGRPPLQARGQDRLDKKT